MEYLKNRYPHENETSLFSSRLEQDADMSDEEICFRDRTCTIPCQNDCPDLEPMVLNYKRIPKRMDWRKTKVVY